MDDSNAVGLAFTGMLTAGFAFVSALFTAAPAAAFGLFAMAVFCAVEFICRLDFESVRKS